MPGKNASAKAKRQQSTAAATGSPIRQPAKEKQNARATGSPQKVPVPRCKRAKTHDTAETASVGEVHPYAFVDGGNIEDPDKEGEPTC